MDPHARNNSGSKSPVDDGMALIDALVNAAENMTLDEVKKMTRAVAGKIKKAHRKIKILRCEMEERRHFLEGNRESIKMNVRRPFLVATVLEIIEMPKEEDEVGEGALRNESYDKITKAVVLKTSTRLTIFTFVPGQVPVEDLKPGDLVAVSRESFLIVERLPRPFDSRVVRMEVTERPKQTFSDIGGLRKQIQELTDAVILPIKERDRFKKIGISPSKGVLLYGPPGTGKTMMARACAGETSSTYIRLAGPQLVEKFLGDGAKMVHDAFTLAKEKAPSIIFIDEIDAVGTKRVSNDRTGDRKIQRTMLALLSEMDGFCVSDAVTVIGATSRVDILDPALLRSGRFDKKIELPLPCEYERLEILKIHSRRMNCRDVDLEEVARTAADFNGAQCMAVCVEAGMTALRRNATVVTHEDFLAGVVEVSAKKKTVSSYIS
ncbi:26S proteasome regulatory subunit 6A-B-like [Penaeus japonicus]|uniref:26S proteasome regulatory subunit 6A-B-like n=1 Tax=Penaeus japonicus TaxID=27405 RepID=UPI001C70D260|nr:26S proteasome regulatory subunit 6A-B-like [Penaeus japonicus]